MRVLELGAGIAALPSLTIAAELDASAIATDLPEVIAEAQACMDKNQGLFGLTEGATVKMAPYAWSEVSAPPGAPFDVVLGADLLYEETSQAGLAAAISSALGTTGRLALLSYEVRNASVESVFFQRLLKLGFSHEQELEVIAPKDVGRGAIRVVAVRPLSNTKGAASVEPRNLESSHANSPSVESPSVAPYQCDLGLYL